MTLSTSAARARPAVGAVGRSVRPAGTRPPAGGAGRRSASTARWMLAPHLRRALLAAHVLVGVGWFGIVAAKLVLEIAAATAHEPDVARAGLLFMTALDRVAFPPAALATLVTGVILAVGTAWGLFRHWWIVAKLVLTVGVVVTGVALVGGWTAQALAATPRPGMAPASGEALGSAASWLIGAAAAHLVMLGAATVLSVFKPWGPIRATARPSAAVPPAP